uniref:Uncharacterized protein n=1 Tax=Oryza nivara TaxID=4536 RepID=A0A0E0I8I0_ORYNI
METFVWYIGPDVEPLVVKPGKTQTQGRSAALGTPRLDAYNGRSFTIPSTSTARRTISSRALCDLSRSTATHVYFGWQPVIFRGSDNQVAYLGYICIGARQVIIPSL